MKFVPENLGSWQRAMQRIGEAISHLIVPSFEPLIGVATNIRVEIAKSRADVTQKMLANQIEADAAATRLMLPDAAALRRSGKSYFEQIEDRRDKDA